MTAKEFILKNYPVTAKDFKNGECVGLHDIAYICEEYHKSKLVCDDCESSDDIQIYCGECMNERY